MITVDVIVPTFNSGGLLVETLDSVAAQTAPPNRIIVVDDGSTDGAVGPATAGRPNLTVIRQDNGGISVARNTGVAHSQADAVLIVDHDDLLSPNGIEVLVAVMEENNDAQLVHGMVQEFVDDRDGLPEGVRLTEQSLRARVSGCTLVRRDLWIQIGGCRPGMTQGEWIDWIDRAMAAGAVAKHVDEVILLRRIHANNFTRAPESKLQYLDVARAALERKRGNMGQ
jgi:glycosyltransferase involved in cell wall biosynthesis